MRRRLGQIQISVTDESEAGDSYQQQLAEMSP
jgi:hypothetical protein